MRIAPDWLVGKGLNKNHNKNHNVDILLFTYNTAHLAPLCMVLAPLCMVLAPVGALNGTRGHATMQQVNASYSKGVHPYNYPTLNKK